MISPLNRGFILILILLVMLLAGSWVLAWKCLQFARYTDRANAFYLGQRNQMIEDLAVIYHAFFEADELFKQLGLSIGMISARSASGLDRLPASEKEQIASLLLIEYAPLDVGSFFITKLLPGLNASAKGVLEGSKGVRDSFKKIGIHPVSLPTIQPAEGEMKSFFGVRTHPISKEKSFHRGIDIANEAGTPVMAAARGKVVLAGRMEGYGKTVILRHGPSLKTQYSHLKDLRVKAGENVQRGEVIGTIGATGSATGPHLHYEIHVHDHPKDPRKFILN